MLGKQEHIEAKQEDPNKRSKLRNQRKNLNLLQETSDVGKETMRLDDYGINGHDTEQLRALLNSNATIHQLEKSLLQQSSALAQQMKDAGDSD